MESIDVDAVDKLSIERTKSALNLIERLKIDEFETVPPVSAMLLIETLVKIFLAWAENGIADRNVEIDDLFNSTWKLLYNLSVE